MSGFTKVDNDILEEVSKRKFNATQLTVLLIVWRMTFGFNREDHEMAVNYFVQMTGFTKRNIQEAIKSLIAGNVLQVTQQPSFTQSRKIAFNKNTDEWLFESRAKLPQVKDSSPHEEKFTSPGEEKFTSPGEESFTHQRKVKEISKEKDDDLHNPDYVASYEKFFGPFPMGIFEMQMNDWIDNSQFKEPEAIICETIKRAKLDSPRNPPAYIQKILVNLHGLGLFTLAQVQEYNAKFDRKYRKKKSVQDIPTKRPDSWKEPESLTDEEYRQMKELEAELPF